MNQPEAIGPGNQSTAYQNPNHLQSIMMKLKHGLAALAIIAAINFTPTIVKAQDFADPDEDPTNVPLDGGVGMLIAAGVVYGLKKRYDDKKQVKQK